MEFNMPNAAHSEPPAPSIQMENLDASCSHGVFLGQPFNEDFRPFSLYDSNATLNHITREKPASGASSVYSQDDLLQVVCHTDHPYYEFAKIPEHPLLLPQAVLLRELVPQSTVWNIGEVKFFIADILGALPSAYNYYEGIWVCRTTLVYKYGIARYMDCMAAFWDMFHQSYMACIAAGDLYGSPWNRWRHDRRLELEQILCYAPASNYPSTTTFTHAHNGETNGDNAGFQGKSLRDYLQQYLAFEPSEYNREQALLALEGKRANMDFYQSFGQKVSEFEIEILGYERCCPPSFACRAGTVMKDPSSISKPTVSGGDISTGYHNTAQAAGGHPKRRSLDAISTSSKELFRTSSFRQSDDRDMTKRVSSICTVWPVPGSTPALSPSSLLNKLDSKPTEDIISLPPTPASVNQDTRIRAINAFAELRIKAIVDNHNSAKSQQAMEVKPLKTPKKNQAGWTKNIFHSRRPAPPEFAHTISSPIAVTKPPMHPNLVPLAVTSPELTRKLTSDCPGPPSPTGLSTIVGMGQKFARGIDPPIINGVPITTLPQSVQGQLYGQLEDFLVSGTTAFLTCQIACLRVSTVRAELARLKAEFYGHQYVDPSSSRFRKLAAKLKKQLIPKEKILPNSEDSPKLEFQYIKTVYPGNEKEGHPPYWPESHQWGLVSGYNLVEANMQVLVFYGPYKANPTSVFRLWNELIQSGYSGKRVRFNDAVVLKHLSTVEHVLELFGQEKPQGFVRMRDEIKHYFLERWRMWSIGNYRDSEEGLQGLNFGTGGCGIMNISQVNSDKTSARHASTSEEKDESVFSLNTSSENCVQSSFQHPHQEYGQVATKIPQTPTRKDSTRPSPFTPTGTTEWADTEMCTTGPASSQLDNNGLTPSKEPDSNRVQNHYGITVVDNRSAHHARTTPLGGGCLETAKLQHNAFSARRKVEIQKSLDRLLGIPRSPDRSRRSSVASYSDCEGDGRLPDVGVLNFGRRMVNVTSVNYAKDGMEGSFAENPEPTPNTILELAQQLRAELAMEMFDGMDEDDLDYTEDIVPGMQRNDSGYGEELA